MSAYLYFFLRKDNTFAPLGCFSRASTVYKMFKNAPYGKIKAISSKQLEDALEILNDQACEWKKEQDKVKSRIELTMRAYNNLNDKMDMVAELEREIEDYQEHIEDNRYAFNYILFLQNAIDNVSYYDNYDPDNFLYAGVEVGNNVEVTDIEED